MKLTLASLGLLLVASTTLLTASAYARGPRGNCAAAALLAAEDFYGNDPTRTQTKEIIPGRVYEVVVGIDNPEDGAHRYRVTFPNGVCNPKQARVLELKWY